VGKRKELIVVKENMVVGIVSALVGLAVGFLVWGASSEWGSAQPGPAMMNGSSSMMSGMSGQMMGGMMQGMGQGMMGQGMMNHHSNGQGMMGAMGEHMAQCQQMMGSMMAMMQQHMQAAPTNETQ
jgi:hypothetical protein